mmetsp:Transcript_21050/g.49507  ORF Transcript_21050/g.49507 Transcript_21050/m.49507 type:complete len:113 (-) Transcript_21050:67-405(-)
MSFAATPAEAQELAVVFASLILHDEGIAIEEDKISALLKAANVTVEPYWPKLFAGLLKDKDVGELLLNQSAPGAGAAPAAAASGDAPAEEAAAEPEEESEDESDDMDFDLFD